MHYVLIISAWIFLLVALLGVTDWIDLRFNWFSWSPQGGLMSVLPYLAGGVVLTALWLVARIPESSTLLLVLFAIASIPMVLGACGLRREPTVGKRKQRKGLKIEVSEDSNLMTIVIIGMLTLAHDLKDNPYSLSRHDGETSPFWYRLHRSLILASPMMFVAGFLINRS